MKRVLILVLSSRREPWGDIMDASMKTWDAEPHPQTRTLYYCAGHNGNSLQHESVRYSTMEDSLENVSPRTIEAFEWALESDDWDYIARPNTPCYVHKANLARHIDALPETGVLRGAWTGGEGGFLWGGGQFILSRDVVQAMVENKGGWANKLMDDEAITRCAKGLGIDLNQGAQFCSIDDRLDGSWSCMCYGGDVEPFTFTDFADLKKAEGHFFFRTKQDHNRRLDEKLMYELKKHLP